jgi:hypothetical protein
MGSLDCVRPWFGCFWYAPVTLHASSPGGLCKKAAKKGKHKKGSVAGDHEILTFLVKDDTFS